MWWEIGLAIGIPGAGVALATIKYFWKKEKCFGEMKRKINELSEHDKGSIEKHDGFDGRLQSLEDNQIKTEIYIKLLLDHNQIPYNP